MKNLVFPVVPEKKSYDWPVIDDIVYVLMSFLKYKAHESINEKTKSMVVSAKTSASEIWKIPSHVQRHVLGDNLMIL